jgi:hypothetical protein
LSYKTDHTQDFPEFCMTKENTENISCALFGLDYSVVLMNRTPYFLIDGNLNITATEVIGEAKILIEKTSDLSGKLTEMLIGINFNDFVKAFDAWDSGELIQNAFPTLSADEREFIKTGILPKEWDAMFGEED